MWAHPVVRALSREIGERGAAFSHEVGSADMPDPHQVHSIALPAGAEPPVKVYVNGEEWSEGTDFVVEGTTVRFTRVLRAQPPMGFGRKVMLAIGIGVYGDLKGDSLDIQYRVGDRTVVTPMPLTGRGAEGTTPPG